MTSFIKTQICSKSIKTWAGGVHIFFRKMITSTVGREDCDSEKEIKRASVVSVTSFFKEKIYSQHSKMLTLVKSG